MVMLTVIGAPKAARRGRPEALLDAMRLLYAASAGQAGGLRPYSPNDCPEPGYHSLRLMCIPVASNELPWDPSYTDAAVLQSFHPSSRCAE